MDQQPNFDFIMNPQKNRGYGDSAGAKRRRIMVVAVGVVGLLVATMVIGGLLSGASGQSNDKVLDLLAYQAELKRVVDLGTERARSIPTKNKAVTASYTLESDYNQTVKIVRARGIKPPEGLTARYKGTESDTALDNAEKANQFDAKYEEILTEKLGNYKVKLAEVYPSLNANEQVIVKQSSDNAKILLGEPVATNQ